MPFHSRRLGGPRTLLVRAALAVLPALACGGGGSSGDGGPTAPPPVTPPAPTTGKLVVTLAKVPPAAVIPPITLIDSAGSSRTILAADTVRALAPGRYTVRVDDILIYDLSFAAPAETITITAGATTTAALTYAPTTGMALVYASGLTGTLNANVTVTGPDTTIVTHPWAQGPALLARLKPGTYTVRADSVSDWYTSWAPTGGPVTFTIAAGDTAKPTVGFRAVTGAIQLIETELDPVDGPHPTFTGDLIRPDGTRQSFAIGAVYSNQLDTAAFPRLASGTYTVAISDTLSVTMTQHRYVVSPGMQTITVVAGEIAHGALSATAAVLGNLSVEVDGIPYRNGKTNAERRVQVVGPNGYTVTIVQPPEQYVPTILYDVPVGDYTLTVASSVTIDSALFVPDSTVIHTTIPKGFKGWATFRYHPSPAGTLRFSFTGIPQGAPPTPVFGVSGTFPPTVMGLTATDVVMGTYNVTPYPFQFNGKTYRAPNQAITVANTTPVDVVIAYTPDP